MPGTPFQRGAALVAAIVALASASACESSVPTADKRGNPAPGGFNHAGTTGGNGGNGGGVSPCREDPQRLSGSSTVMWTADSLSEHKASEATPETTMLLGSSGFGGLLFPAHMNVRLGEVFTFGLTEGNREVAAIKVGCSKGQTVYPGPALAAEYITDRGTWDIVNELANKRLGTVTVE